MSDLWDQAEHTKVLKAVHNSATALGSHLQFISSAKDKVAGVGAILRPVTSGTQVIFKLLCLYLTFKVRSALQGCKGDYWP